MPQSSERRRSVAFLDREGEEWTAYLVTYPDADGLWHGYFAFRPGHGDLDDDDVRTADIFLEASEGEILVKARSLGRPLLRGLLESAHHMSARANGSGPKLRGAFRTLLRENAHDIAGDWATEGDAPSREADGLDVERLRSLYASYRLDQVSHFICLVDPDAFEDAVDRILDGERIDFRANDRIQFAMMVVDFIERHLPLPDFETWARDFLAHPEAYRLYTHTLHREGRLP